MGFVLTPEFHSGAMMGGRGLGHIGNLASMRCMYDVHDKESTFVQ